MHRRQFLVTGGSLLALALAGCGSSQGQASGGSGSPLVGGVSPSSSLVLRTGTRVATGSESRIYEVDPANHRVTCFDNKDRRIWNLGDVLQSTPLNRPIQVIELPDGRALIADQARGEVILVNTSGEVVAAWGRGLPNTVMGLAYDSTRQRVLVSNGLAGQIELYSLSGVLLGTFTNFHAPRGLALAPDGRLYVAEPASSRISILGPDGQLLRRLEAGLQAPNDLVLGETGSLLVADPDQGLVALDPQGGLVGKQALPLPNGFQGRPLYLGTLRNQLHITISIGA